MEEKQLNGNEIKPSILAYRKQWYQDHKKEMAAYQKQYRIDHKEKLNTYKKQYGIDNKEKLAKQSRKLLLLKCYNITPEEYDKIYKQQEGKCDICGTHQSKFKTRLHVDHNHETGEVRGLLCYKCNMILGYSNDDIKILEYAIKYLIKYRSDETVNK